MSAHGPARYPCASCPYRKDVASGVWAAGWCGTHDMDEALALRLAHGSSTLTADDINAALNYESPVPLWESGQAAADHGTAEIEAPGPKAVRTMEKLTRRRERRSSQ